MRCCELISSKTESRLWKIDAVTFFSRVGGSESKLGLPAELGPGGIGRGGSPPG
jgi:hypothetical protein